MKILRWLDDKFEETLLLVFLCIMVAIMALQVFARYALSASLSWSEEVTRYLFVCSGFISASYCCKKGISIKIDQLVGMLPEKGAHLLKLMSYTIELLFFGYMTPFAYSFVQSAVESGQKTAATGIPMWVVELSALIGFALCFVRLAQKWVQRLRIIMGKTKGEE